MQAMTRDEVIQALRTRLMSFVDEEVSICEAAARHGFFCHGFARWTFGELRTRHPTIVRSRRRITPAELRELANRWQLARQTARGTEFACDTQMCEGALRTCHGWNEFTTEELAHFLEELGDAAVESGPPAKSAPG
ncbi:MAG: hypothetical protein EXS08_02935 [Planctomycetes bacterium]|nr:hypothetical protein [Planctomycetota bacterium]